MDDLGSGGYILGSWACRMEFNGRMGEGPWLSCKVDRDQLDEREIFRFETPKNLDSYARLFPYASRRIIASSLERSLSIASGMTRPSN